MMRTSVGGILLLLLVTTMPLRAQGPTGAEVVGLPRPEPTGLSLPRPYQRGKVPVVFVHGLWLSPRSWSGMIGALGADESLRDRYQFWTYGYSTGDPLPCSADRFRRALDVVRAQVDPDGSDAAFDRMVLVGHSMGGLLSKMMVQESGARLWAVASTRPFDAVRGDPADLDLLRRALFFAPRPEVRRVIFIAVPHRGSHFARGPIPWLGDRLVRLPDPLRGAYARLIAANPPDFFESPFRDGLPTSIDELRWESPFLTALGEVPIVSTVKYHSIIAGSDGVVSYASAHLDGAASELLVTAGHLCQDHPEVIREVRRILAEHDRP